MALVVSGAAGQSAAFSVQRNLPGSDYFQDGRTDPSVDVILTGDFKELAKPELVDQTPGQLSCPREDRRIVDESGSPVDADAGPAGGLARGAGPTGTGRQEVTRRGRPSSSNRAPAPSWTNRTVRAIRASASASPPAPSPRAALEDRVPWMSCASWVMSASGR